MLAGMAKRHYDRVRKIALALPGVNERMSHGARCFFVQDKRPLCYYHDDHRGDGRVSLWCPALFMVQQALVSAEPERFFKPQMSAAGHFGNWLGIFLDTPNVDWNEIAVLLEGAFRAVAPRRLIAELDKKK